MRQHKFPTALLLSPEDSLATDLQTALRHFGLKQLTVAKDLKGFEEQTWQQSPALALIDTDSLSETEKKEHLEKVIKIARTLRLPCVAIAKIQTQEELVSLREGGFALVLVKPLSVAMMEQAFSELIERERTEPIGRKDLLSVYESFLRGHGFEAERTLCIWLEKEPASLEALTVRALLFLKKQEFYRADNAVMRALKIKSDYLPALQVRTRICLRLGQLNEAMQSLSKEEMVVARFEAKREHEPTQTLTPEDDAELSFCEDFETREGITALLNNLALQLSKIGHLEHALTLYRRALGPLETPESRFITLFNRARLYMKLKRHEEASRDLQEAKQLAPEELLEKIEELLTQCTRNIRPTSLGQPEQIRQIDSVRQLDQQPFRVGATTAHTRADTKAKVTPQSKYRPFKKNEVLELIFLGKMDEATVPPESMNEWLDLKRRLTHIFFFSELPLMSETANDQSNSTEQGNP